MDYIVINEWQRFLYLSNKLPAPEEIRFQKPNAYSKYSNAANVFVFDERLITFLIAHNISHFVQAES